MSFEDCNEYSEDFFVEEEKKNNDGKEDDSSNDLSMNASIEFHPSIIESILEEDEDDDDDGDGINNNVMLTPSKTTGRVVKFADDEAEKRDARRDKDRSRQELLSKIARLTDHLKDVQSQVKVEKDKRKKKERSLLKLAKELRKRNTQKESDTDRMEELEEKKKYLEHHWVLAQKELDQEKSMHTKLHEDSQKEYEHSVKDEKFKYERTVQENENRLVDLKKAHTEQCDELGREILKANLEADRLHNELAARGMNVPRRSLFNSKENKQTNMSWRMIVSFLVILSGMAYFILEKSPEIFTRSGLCSPVMPGTTLDDNSHGVFEAPWWTPSPLKQQVFTTFCADNSFTNNNDSTKTLTSSIPSSIEWTRDGKNNKLAISVEGEVVLKKTTAKTQITSHNIQFWKRNGYFEEISFNWSLDEHIR